MEHTGSDEGVSEGGEDVACLELALQFEEALLHRLIPIGCLSRIKEFMHNASILVK